MPWLGGVDPAVAPWLCLPAASLSALNAERKEWAEGRLFLLYKSGFMSWHSVVCASGLLQRRDNSKTSLLARLPLAQSSSFSCSPSVGSQVLSQSQSVWQSFTLTAFGFYYFFHCWTRLEHYFTFSDFLCYFLPLIICSSTHFQYLLLPQLISIVNQNRFYQWMVTKRPKGLKLFLLF